MNERIKELMKQAGIVPVYRHRDAEGCWYETANYEAVRFAEILIRECARSVDKVYEDAEPVYGRNDCSIFAQGIDVLKHFGVEP
jgi:hypothetical protein